MPIIKIELAKPMSDSNKQRLVQFVHSTMVEVLKIPQHDRLIRIVEYPAVDFYAPTNCSNNFVVFDITLFPGRTVETKRLLYKTLCEGMQKFGIAVTDTRIVLHEVPMENWAIRGGQVAADVVLGFKTDV